MSRRYTDAAEALTKIQAMLDTARAGGQGGFGFDIDEASRILSAASLKQEPESKHPGRTPDSVATELLSDDDVESIPKLERVKSEFTTPKKPKFLSPKGRYLDLDDHDKEESTRDRISRINQARNRVDAQVKSLNSTCKVLSDKAEFRSWFNFLRPHLHLLARFLTWHVCGSRVNTSYSTPEMLLTTVTKDNMDNTLNQAGHRDEDGNGWYAEIRVRLYTSLFSKLSTSISAVCKSP